jgi:hypothetical protein
MSCNDRISDRCPNKVNAKCVSYEGAFSSESTLNGNCHNIEEIIEDINTQLDYLKATTNVDSLSNDTCIQYVDQAPYPEITPRTAILTLNQKVRQLMDFVGLGCDDSTGDCPAVFNQDLTCLGLNFGTLADPCGNPPSTLKAVLQLVLDELQPQP